MLHPARALALVASLAAACGGPSHRAQRRAPPAAAVTALHVRTTVYGGAALELGTVEDGLRGALAGGHRYRWSGPAQVEVADEVLGAGLAGAVRHADGWRFADRRGDLWSASSFLGPLTHAGTLGIRHFEIVPARGTIALLAKNRTRALLLSDGRGPARQSCPFPVLSAAFVDAMHGLVVADGGGLFRTEDGGATWLAVATSEGSAAGFTGPFVSVDLDAEGLVAIARPSGAAPRRFRVSSSGAFSPVAADPGAPSSLDEQRDRAALSAMAIADGFLSFPTTALLDGVAVTSLIPDRTRVDLAAHRMTPIDALPPGCLTQVWGARFLAVCTDDARVGDGRNFRRLAGVPGLAAAGEHTASADGRSLAWFERMDEDDAHVRIVVLGPEDRTRSERVVDAARFDLLSVHGSTLLIDDPGPTIRLLDVASGRAHSIDVPGTMLGAHISANGDVLVSSIDGGDSAPRAVLLRGRFDGDSLEAVTTPRGAIAAGLVDARHGLAVGETYDEIRTTSDGGASWQSLVVAPPAEAALLRSPVTGAESESLFGCNASRCMIAPSRERPGVTVVFGGPPIGSPRVLRVASADPPIEAVTPDAASSTHLACEVEPVANERPRALAPGAFATATATGTVRLRRRGTSSTVELSWTGRDASGIYRARARGVGPTNHAELPPAHGRALWLSRAFAVIEICYGRQCAHVGARAGGTVEPWTSGITPLAETDEGAMLAVGATADGSGLEVSALRDGATTTLRRFVLPDASTFGLASGSSLAVVARTPSGRWRLYPFDASAPPRAYPSLSGELPVCSGPAVPEATTIRFVGGPLLDGVAPATTVVELARESVCVRTIELAPIDSLPVTFRGVLTASSGGLLEGRLERWEGVVGGQTVARNSGERGFRCRLAD